MLEDEKPLRLGSRALEILIALVEHAGETVLKDQLIARVWPNTVVEEGALRVHVAALRKALGDGRGGNRFIANIPGRGYSLVAPVTRDRRQEAMETPSRAVLGGNLPVSLTRLIGRGDVVETIMSRVAQRRFLTIVGPGGIGKTTVAIAAAEAMSTSYADGIWFAGLAALADATLVPGAVGAALGMAPTNVDPLQALPAWLRDRQMLIVLDSCEHVAVAAATLAETVLRAAPRVCILATSREPLRAEGEWLLRLPSLEVPTGPASLTAAEALSYPAIQLFNDRATATMDSFVLADADVPDVLEICRRLDGVPLALELAAAQVDVFGIKGLAARIDDRLALLTKGRRTVLPRQQTLRTTLDWSFGLLSESEQIVLRRLAVFRGDFTMDGAAAVATNAQIAASGVFDVLANLVAKSLIETDIGGDVTYYRLLGTTRAYAMEKLIQAGEIERVRHLHAEYFRDFFALAEAENEASPVSGWLAVYGRQIDNARAGLDWAFSSDHGAEIGVALTVNVVPLWARLSLFGEAGERIERALARLDPDAEGTARARMQLAAALATAFFHLKGAVPEVEVAWATTFDIADRLDETDYQLRALWGLWSYSISAGDYQRANGLGRRFHETAKRRNDVGDLLIAERMIGGALHFLGDQAAARRHIEAMLSQYDESLHRPHIVRFHYDQRLAAQVTLARILWVQGFPDQAMRAAAAAVEEAEKSRHPISLCFALNEAATPVALFAGDLVSAERYIAALLGESEQHALTVFYARAKGAAGILASKRGDPHKGIQLIRDALLELDKSGYHAYPLLLGSLAEALGAVGDIEEGLTSVENALSRCERHGERWYIADLLRIKGELNLRLSDPEALIRAASEFLSSLDWARRQSALSWELRAATSLARLWAERGRRAEARELLAPIYGGFTEGFDTTDLKAARTLLDAPA